MVSLPFWLSRSQLSQPQLNLNLIMGTHHDYQYRKYSMQAECPKQFMLFMYYLYYVLDYELYKHAKGEMYIFVNKDQKMKYYQHLFGNSVQIGKDRNIDS